MINKIKKILDYKLPKPDVSEIILLISTCWFAGFTIAYLHWGQGIPW